MVAAAVVAAAIGVSVFVLLRDEGPPPPPPAQPLSLSAPRTVEQVFDVTGASGELPREDVGAIVAIVERYVRAASIGPLEHDPDAESDDGGDDGGSASEAPPPLRPLFTEAARPRLGGEDRLALADDHLPFARYGVSTERATLDLAALVEEDRGVVAVATIDLELVARFDRDVLEDFVVIDRTGDLILERVDDRWRIGGYHLRTERSFRGRTTTTEASFG